MPSRLCTGFCLRNNASSHPLHHPAPRGGGCGASHRWVPWAVSTGRANASHDRDPLLAATPDPHTTSRLLLVAGDSVDLVCGCTTTCNGQASSSYTIVTDISCDNCNGAVGGSSLRSITLSTPRCSPDLVIAAAPHHRIHPASHDADLARGHPRIAAHPKPHLCPVFSVAWHGSARRLAGQAAARVSLPVSPLASSWPLQSG